MCLGSARRRNCRRTYLEALRTPRYSRHWRGYCILGSATAFDSCLSYLRALLGATTVFIAVGDREQHT